MAKAKQSNFEMYRNFAQYFTMTAAILYAVVWVFTRNSSSSSNSLGDVLIAATAVGGVVMGLLYVVHLLKKK